MKKYFIGSGANFADDANWSSSSGGANNTTKPTATDDAVLDAASGNCTINTGSVCRSINCTGYTGVLTHTASVTLSIGDSAPGDGDIALKFVAGMTYTLGNTDTSYIQFVSTSNTEQTIDFGGKTTSRVTFSGIGGNWKYISGHTTTSFRSGVGIIFNAGTLNLNGQTFSLSYGHNGPL